MPVVLKPETERLLREEMETGRFDSADELIREAVSVWREKQRVQGSEPATERPGKHIFELLTHPPFAGSELSLQREKEHPRRLDL